jgi:hypothetical protein
MRNWIIGAAALLALAVPGVAAAQSGFVGVTAGNIEVDDFDADVYGAEGSVAFSGSDSITFELDAAVMDSDDTDTSTSLAGHIFARNENHLFGGFLGVTDSDNSTTWSAGLEAAKYFADWTFAGALFYANNDDANADGYGVNLEARVFPTDNFRLQGNLGVASADFDGGDDTAYTYGVGGEFQFEQVPVSLALVYNHTELDDFDENVDSWSAALRYNWGGTLKNRDRNGASQGNSSGFGPSFLAL